MRPFCYKPSLWCHHIYIKVHCTSAKYTEGVMLTMLPSRWIASILWKTWFAAPSLVLSRVAIIHSTYGIPWLRKALWRRLRINIQRYVGPYLVSEPLQVTLLWSTSCYYLEWFWKLLIITIRSIHLHTSKVRLGLLSILSYRALNNQHPPWQHQLKHQLSVRMSSFHTFIWLIKSLINKYMVCGFPL